MAKPWFGAKAYGIGITPTSGGGWAAIGAWVIAMSAVSPAVDMLHWPAWTMFLGLTILTTALLLLMKFKGDGRPWKWRWGEDS